MRALHRRIIIVALLLSSTSFTWPSILPGVELDAPRAVDRQITLVVTSLMRREHLSRHPLDDEISQRVLDSYLTSLDPLKLYFSQADIDEFQKDYRDKLDDLLKQRDTQFAYTVFNRYLKRLDERIELVDELLKSEHDFNIDEEVVIDPEAAAYAANEQEVRERWRRRIKYDLLFLKGEKTEGKEATDKLTQRYHNFQKRMHQTDHDELLERFLTSVTSCFDPHTTYFSPSSLEDFRIRLGLNYQGIGAELEPKDGYAVIRRIISGGAADKAGELKAKDRIVSVGQGDEGAMVDVVDMKLDDIIQLIRGKEGTVVRLGVIPDGESETKIYKITRARIELQDNAAKSTILSEPGEQGSPPTKIGVINLPSFYMDMEAARQGGDYKSTTKDVQKILQDFTEKGVQVVVLDLRRNGGGSLTEAINLTGLFIDQGPVVQVKSPDGKVQRYDDLNDGMAWDGPLVVLTSKFSASASEILAGAIQDYRRGLIVGDKSTHGKGTVQSLLDLGREIFRVDNPRNLGALKITMQQFYRPNGDSTQNRGVLADVELPSISNHIAQGEADLDYAISFDQIPAAKFTDYQMVIPEMLSELRSASRDRLEQSKDFEKLRQDIERYRQRKARKTLPLNEEKFLALHKQTNPEKEEEEQLEQLHDVSGQVVKRDFYFNEVIAITLDYLRLLDKKQTVAQAGG